MRIKFYQLLVLIAVATHAVGAQNDIKLEINSKLAVKYAKNPKGRTFTAASQTFPYIEVTIKEVDYLIAFDEASRKIKYIYTDDEDFKSSNGLEVDQEVTFKWDEIEVLGYFQLRGPEDKDGWQPVIGGASAFEGDFLERVEKAGQLTTEIDGFAKGYNY